MLGKLIIQLYRAAQEMAVDEFQEFSVGLFKSLVSFDSARYVNGVLTQQGPQIQEFFLHNKSIEAITGYPAIAHIDPVVKAGSANPGKIIRFHPPTLYAAKKDRPLLDYARRNEHANGMTALYMDHDSPAVQSISVFRADEDNHFQAMDGIVLEQIYPHFLEALKINKAYAVRSADKNADRSMVAIASRNGGLHFCGTGFRKLLNTEWPDWEGSILPGPLTDALVRTGSARFCSASLQVSAKCIGELLFLKASRVAASALRPAIAPALLQSAYGLTHAEARVAIALLDGGTAKEVAAQLKVSPNTVRTQIKQIYVKLAVDSRARLVKLILGTAQPQ